MISFFWESVKSALSMWYAWVVAVFTISEIISIVLRKSSIKFQIPIWVSKTILTLFIISILFALFRGSFQVYNSKESELIRVMTKYTDLQKKISEEVPESFATPDQLIGQYYEGLDIRLADLARESNVIKNKKFVNCRLFGPAVILPFNCSFRGIKISSYESNLEDNISTFYIPLPKTKTLQGIIRLENIDFRDCALQNIAFMGPDTLKNQLFLALKSKQ